jgi:hypothetical protein
MTFYLHSSIHLRDVVLNFRLQFDVDHNLQAEALAYFA